MKKLGYLIIFSISLTFGYAQKEQLASLIKPEVQKSQMMFKRNVWRRMNLKQKQNRPFFSLNGEVTRLLIKGVNEGLITPYQSDSCKKIMSDLSFQSNISVEREKLDGNDNFGGFDSFGNDEGESGGSQSSASSLELIPKDLFSVIYLREDLVFDRNRSRMYNYIRSISIALPREAGTAYNPAGFERIVVHFKYEDMVDLFRGPYVNEAIFYNAYNPSKHLNMSDAFELRLYNAPITKLSNPEDLDIRQIYADELAKDPMSVILIQQKYEYDLMEYEAELWEY